MAMGEHVCNKSPINSSSSPLERRELLPTSTSLATSAMSRIAAKESKGAKFKPLAPIDSVAANKAFLRPSPGNFTSRSASPLTASSRPRSPFRAPQSSLSARLPPNPSSPPGLVNLDCAFPPFPAARSRSATKTGVPPLLKLHKPSASDQPPIPPLQHRRTATPAVNEELNNGQSPMAPPPLSQSLPESKDQASSSTTMLDMFHRRNFSVDSKSSYRTSHSSKLSMAMSNHRPSVGSLLRAARPSEDVPPMPPPPARSQTGSPSSFGNLSQSVKSTKIHHSERSERDLDLGITTETSDSRAEDEEADSGLYKSLREHLRLDVTNLSEENETSTSAPAEIKYQPFRPSAFSRENHETQKEYDGFNADQKFSDMDSDDEETLSVSNFARSLGLDISDSSAESSSSEFSRPETGSGSSMSSLPSEENLSRYKPLEPGRLYSVSEESLSRNRRRMLDESAQSESPTELEPPPPLPMHLVSPDSPTDPAILQGSVSLIPENKCRQPEPRSPLRPNMPRSATAPTPRARPKGRCKGCGELIMGKSVSSADGRLTGRYHRACFVCYHCRAPFETADFYVLDDHPYCAQHYHELNGSLCSSCNQGIEGQYLETVERTGHGPSDRQKFHPGCLRCFMCQISLNGDYFEWNGQVYCERDARRAAAMPPRNYRRPTVASSPLSPYPPGSSGRLDPYGLGHGHYPAPSGPKRFPERRTTRLMMI
ncbi:hypothetical protein MPDQ_005452 [Monascus purpureus]|uniref:LIM zinc-binding domain-containing protein n=1 Tax=Monascus purpureus TaxID=5098 RepID=A0A507QWC4_MONPU|nr:hypothetical protein MPDQ_005452 [Monascus purpureus]